jgi:hypothetical protein
MGTSYGLVRSVAPAAEAAAPGTVTELWLYYWSLGSPSVFRAYSYQVESGAMELVEEITAPSGGTSSSDDWGAQGAFTYHSLGADGAVSVYMAPNRFIWKPGAGGLVFAEDGFSAGIPRTPFVWVNGFWHYVFQSATLGWRLFRRSADLLSAEGISDYEASLAGVALKSACGSDEGLFYAWKNSANTPVAFAFGAGVPALTGTTASPLGVCDPADAGLMWDHIANEDAQAGRVRDPLADPAATDRYPGEAPWKLFPGIVARIRHHYRDGHVLAYGRLPGSDTSFKALLHNNVTAEAGETPTVAVFSPPTDPAGSEAPWGAAIKTIAS